MKLIHRTNYWGNYIDSSYGDRDDEVDFDAIWAQAVGDYDGPCCPRGFGRRSVEVVNSDFMEEHNSWWSVFLVSSQRGGSSCHYFYKFAVIPQGIPHYGKKSCIQRRGWTYKGEFYAGDALEDLENILEYYLELDDDDINHVHVAIYMEGLRA